MEKKKNTVEWGGQAWTVAEFGRADLFEFEDEIRARRVHALVRGKMACPALGLDAFASALAEVSCLPLSTVQMFREVESFSALCWIAERAVRGGREGQWEKLCAHDGGRLFFDMAGLWGFVRAALPIFEKKKPGESPDPTGAATPTSTS